MGKARRWRIAGRDDLAVMANTKSEAVAWFKRELGLARLAGLTIIGEVA